MRYGYEFPDSFYDDDSDEFDDEDNNIDKESMMNQMEFLDNSVTVLESEYEDLKHRATLLDDTTKCMKKLAIILRTLIACAYDTDDILEAELAKEEFIKCNNDYRALTGVDIIRRGQR